MINVVKFFETKEKIFIFISLYFIVYFLNFTETFTIHTFSMSKRIVMTYISLIISVTNYSVLLMIKFIIHVILNSSNRIRVISPKVVLRLLAIVSLNIMISGFSVTNPSKHQPVKTILSSLIRK